MLSRLSKSHRQINKVNMNGLLNKPINNLKYNSNNRSFYRIIPQGNEAYRLFLGKNPKKLQSGIHVALAFIRTVIQVDIRECSINIGNLNTYTKR